MNFSNFFLMSCSILDYFVPVATYSSSISKYIGNRPTCSFKCVLHAHSLHLLYPELAWVNLSYPFQQLFNHFSLHLLTNWFACLVTSDVDSVCYWKRRKSTSAGEEAFVLTKWFTLATKSLLHCTLLKWLECEVD